MPAKDSKDETKVSPDRSTPYYAIAEEDKQEIMQRLNEMEQIVDKGIQNKDLPEEDMRRIRELK